MSDNYRYRWELHQVVLLPDETVAQAKNRLDPDDEGDKYLFGKTSVWEIKYLQEEYAYDDILESHTNDDNTISFFTQFYNGWTCLSEMLESLIK